MEKKVKSKKQIDLKITSILIIILAIIMIVEFCIQTVEYNKISGLRKEYETAKQADDRELEADKEKWEQINEYEELAYDSGTSREQSEKYIISISDIKQQASDEFYEAIEWAEQQNGMNEFSKVTPFDKEGFVYTYYTKSNEINEKISNIENRVGKINLNSNCANFAMMILIVQLVIILIMQNTETKNYMLKIMYILAIILIVLAII